MGIVLVVTVVAVVFVIAAYAIGREARRLDAQPPRAVFDLDEAVEFVARHVPFEVSAQLSYDDVRQVLRWHLEYLRTRGAATNGDGPHEGAPIVVGGSETVDYLLHRATEAGVELTATQAHAVLDAQMTYLESIGAVGPSEGGAPGAGG